MPARFFGVAAAPHAPEQLINWAARVETNHRYIITWIAVYVSVVDRPSLLILDIS